MKKHITHLGLVLILIPCIASGSEGVTLRAGLWRITTAVDGLPMGGESRTQTICLNDNEKLSKVPEQTFIEAAQSIDAKDKNWPPKCKFSNYQRTNDQSKWTATCDMPPGPATGSGAATLGQEIIDLTQTLNLKFIFGEKTIQNKISAAWVSECN